MAAKIIACTGSVDQENDARTFDVFLEIERLTSRPDTHIWDKLCFQLVSFPLVYYDENKYYN